MGLEKITEVKEEWQKYLKFSIGDGSQISFGMICGTQMEFYMKKTKLARVIYDAASSMDTKLTSMLRDGDWR